MTDPLISPYRSVAALSALLDEAARPGGPLDPAIVADLDAREDFPADACAVLDAAGLPAHYVPVGHGGRLADLAELLHLLAAVAARDLTVAVAHGKTFLGAVSAWVGGGPEQAAWLARQVLDGTVVCWALTEPGHGSDLLAGEATATGDPAGGWRLTGRKVFINNATRGRVACVLARTAEQGGARGFSLFLFDKRSVPVGGYRCLPKLHTHGIRGADISGLALNDLAVPAGALVGEVGQGLEIVLKGLQLTRIVSTSLSVGAVEHALRLAAGFAATRRVAGRRLADLPHARRVLGTAVATGWLASAAATVAARCAHAVPGELSVVSAVAKALVPGLVDGALAELGDLLGARSFLTGAYAAGAYQKLERDHRIVAIFDGSTAVNRYALIAQFPVLARAYRAGRVDPALEPALELPRPPGPVAFGGLGLASRTGCSLVQAVPAMVDRVIAALPHTADLARRFAAAVAQVIADIAGYRPVPRPPADAFELAARYESGFAGAAALGLYLANPGRLDERWLRACLVRACVLLGEPLTTVDLTVLDELPIPGLPAPAAEAEAVSAA